MKNGITKVKRTISLDKKLYLAMEQLILNKSKYIEWLIIQDIQKYGLYKK